MPRGFLVKRHQKCQQRGPVLPVVQQTSDVIVPPTSQQQPSANRMRRYSDDDRSESSSPEHELDLHHPSGTYIGRLVEQEDRSSSPKLTSAADIFNFQPHVEDDDMPLALTTKPSPHDLSHHRHHHHHPHRPYFPLERLIMRRTPSPPPKSAEKILANNGYKKRVYPQDQADSPTKKQKAVRKLNFDEDKSSPVSGTIIRDPIDDEEDLGDGVVRRRGDIDASLNLVEVTPEAKAEIAKIDNKIGDYVCRLCREFYPDAFGLAQHRCSRIVHIEYRCPECDKVFNCPANLASHRRWHKPRNPPTISAATTARNTPSPAKSDASSAGSDAAVAAMYSCEYCDKKFKRQAYLRKHLQIHVKKNDVLKNGTAASVQAVSTPDYKCKLCISVFYSLAGLTRHINTHHQLPPPSSIAAEQQYAAAAVLFQHSS